MLWMHSGGCIHEDIAKRLPELAPYIKWHLCATDEPMHYLANTLYLAGDRDHWGLRRGEFRQFTDKATGLPEWELTLEETPGKSFLTQSKTTAAATEPPPVTLRWKPYGRTGEGKERELDAARKAALWPEATDADLTEPGLKERLEARQSALLAEFRAAVESFGFVY